MTFYRMLTSLVPIARAGRERQLKNGTPCSLQDVIARMEARERQQRKALASIAVDMECSRLEMEVRIGQTQTTWARHVLTVETVCADTAGAGVQGDADQVASTEQEGSSGARGERALEPNAAKRVHRVNLAYRAHSTGD